MEQSLFIQYVQKYFPGVVVRIVETLNGTKNPLPYLHLRMMNRDLSVTGKWESLSIANSMVMADIVAFDSPLPLKSRDSIMKANGDIPKVGMELALNEKELTDLDTLIAQGGTETQIVQKLFLDAKRCITGVYERNEHIFLQGLSTGVALVDDTKNVGTGIRIDYGYPTANKFGTTVVWSTPSTATPIDDFQRVFDKAALDGNSISKVLMDSFAFNNMVKTTQFKELFGFSLGYVGEKLFAPDLAQANRLLENKFGFTIELVNRALQFEKNGNRTSFKGWSEGAVVFLPGEQVGTLIYARLAEENHKVAGVEYQKVDDYILVSKYRMNKPSLSEYTSSQARVIPVIMNVDQIYLLDSKTVQA